MVVAGGDDKFEGRSTFSLCEEQRMSSLLVMSESCAAVHTVRLLWVAIVLRVLGMKRGCVEQRGYQCP